MSVPFDALPASNNSWASNMEDLYPSQAHQMLNTNLSTLGVEEVSLAVVGSIEGRAAGEGMTTVSPFINLFPTKWRKR